MDWMWFGVVSGCPDGDGMYIEGEVSWPVGGSNDDIKREFESYVVWVSVLDTRVPKRAANDGDG